MYTSAAAQRKTHKDTDNFLVTAMHPVKHPNDLNQR
jgi:hypothetical protein